MVPSPMDRLSVWIGTTAIAACRCSGMDIWPAAPPDWAPSPVPSLYWQCEQMPPAAPPETWGRK